MKLWRILLWAQAFGFFFEQNCYFGWNAMPHSVAELIADGITSVLFSIAVFGTLVSK